MKLKNKNIIITGAGRGIGRETAIRLSELGANIILLSRTEKELKETLAIVKKNSPNSLYNILDITDDLAVKNTINRVIEKFKQIHVLINNAGIQFPIGPFLKNDLKEWKRNIEVNLLGTINCTHAVLSNMIKFGHGKIINMSGGGATSPRSNFSAYGVAKTGIVRFTETLAEELRDKNIYANCVAPGAINTKMLDEVIQAGESAGSEFNDAIERQEKGGTDIKVPTGLISFLVSEESDGITGKIISAPWDKWQDADFQNELRVDKDIATLRRIDNKYFYKKK